MHLIQTAYHSRSRLGSDGRAMLQGLREILAAARGHNEAAGITGYLAFDKVSFVQILEGPRAAVAELMATIRNDPRHETVVVLGQRTIATRDFDNWAMGGGLRTVDQQEVYLRHGFSQGMDPARLTLSRLVALARDLVDLEAGRRRSDAETEQEAEI